jgi:Sulfotransferase family
MDEPVVDQPIDITDLTHPTLSGIQKAAVEAAEAQPVRLYENAVLAAAREATGLSDFGDEDFRPRLRLWLSETEADQDLTNLGRQIMYDLMVTYARNRLRIEDMVKRHPEILDVQIDRPIIVAGLPRAGTTHLQNFLSVDPRLRELPMWEATSPVPGPEDAPTASDPNPRRTRALLAWRQFDAIVPYTKNIHEMSPDYVSEDIELQCLDFGSYYPEWRIFAPRWRDHYLSMDHTSVYRYMKKALQVITFLKGPNRWVLKCPQHMEQLIPLFNVFPDATVAITHRDPVASIQSALVGVCYISRITRKRIDPEQIAAYWVDRYERLLRACVRDRNSVPDAQIVDVYFDQLVSAPMSIMEEIYSKAQLPLNSDIRKIMEQFLVENPRGKHGRILYNLKRDFNLTAADIRERFGFYYDRFAVKRELI